MDIRRLQHIVALADRRNFARAAEQLHLSQPALTRSIQAAEEEFGLRLFDRGAGEVRPTPAGEFVLERARRMVFDSRCLKRDVELFRNRQVGDTACGFGPLPTQTLLAPLLQAARTEFPQVHLRALVGNWEQLLQRLKAGEIEFFVADTRELPPSAALEIHPLPAMRGGMFVRPGHPLAAHKQASLAQLHACGLAAVRLPASVRSALSRTLGLADERQLLALECDDVATLVQVTQNSDTVLAAVYPAVARELAAGTLQPLAVGKLPAIPSSAGVVWQQGRSLSPVAQWLVEHLRELAQVQADAPLVGS